MKRALSLYLSIGKASPCLGSKVASALEILAELHPDYEVVLVDRAGAEETAEMARELAATYPQVRVIDDALTGDELPTRRPRPADQVVLLADASQDLRASDLRWQYYAAVVRPRLPMGWPHRTRKSTPAI